jgi:hypothetical protein
MCFADAVCYASVTDVLCRLLDHTLADVHFLVSVCSPVQSVLRRCNLGLGAARCCGVAFLEYCACNLVWDALAWLWLSSVAVTGVAHVPVALVCLLFACVGLCL